MSSATAATPRPGRIVSLTEERHEDRKAECNDQPLCVILGTLGALTENMLLVDILLFLKGPAQVTHNRWLPMNRLRSNLATTPRVTVCHTPAKEPNQARQVTSFRSYRGVWVWQQCSACALAGATSHAASTQRTLLVCRGTTERLRPAATEG